MINDRTQVRRLSWGFSLIRPVHHHALPHISNQTPGASAGDVIMYRYFLRSSASSTLATTSRLFSFGRGWSSLSQCSGSSTHTPTLPFIKIARRSPRPSALESAVSSTRSSHSNVTSRLHRRIARSRAARCTRCNHRQQTTRPFQTSCVHRPRILIQTHIFEH